MDQSIYKNKEMTLLDLLDGIIDTGVVISGDLVISIADIDLILIDLKLLISAIDSAFENPISKITGGVP
jgi:gas vesicle structural protein